MLRKESYHSWFCSELYYLLTTVLYRYFRKYSFEYFCLDEYPTKGSRVVTKLFKYLETIHLNAGFHRIISSLSIRCLLKWYCKTILISIISFLSGRRNIWCWLFIVFSFNLDGYSLDVYYIFCNKWFCNCYYLGYS